MISALSERTEDQFTIRAEHALPKGAATVTFAFTSDNAGKQSGGRMCLLIKDKVDTCARIPRTPTTDAGQGETVDIGKDTGAPVTADYPDGQPFEGIIRKVTITLPNPATP